MPSMGYGDVVNDALARLDGLGYEWGVDRNLVNHGPMGAEALAVLGYPEQVGGWADGYRRAKQHRPAPRVAPATTATRPRRPSRSRDEPMT